MPIRVVLVDDHQIVLHGLRELFERREDFRVLAACSDASSAIEAMDEHEPDVLVLDLRLPDQSGLDVLRALAGKHERCRRVLLTAAIRDAEVVEAVKLGVRGVVLKESPPEVLLECIRAVHAGKQWIERETVTRALHSAVAQDTDKSPDALTPREIEIVRMVAQGLRNKAIAERLSISEGTVKVHLHNIYEKMGVDGRLELVLSAQQKRLL